MKRHVFATLAAVAVLVVWWTVVLTQVVTRTWVAELLGLSLALNTGLLVEVTLADHRRGAD